MSNITICDVYTYYQYIIIHVASFRRSLLLMDWNNMTDLMQQVTID